MKKININYRKISDGWTIEYFLKEQGFKKTAEALWVQCYYNEEKDVEVNTFFEERKPETPETEWKAEVFKAVTDETAQEEQQTADNQTTEQPEEQAKPGNGKPKTCKRPKGEKSHCIMSASSLKALETMINSYFFSKNYIITEDMTVYNTAAEKTLDIVYVKFTPAGRYQCRKIDVFGESKEPEKAE